MHETDAMQFIEPVFIGFLDRYFHYKESEEPDLIEPRLEKIKTFIRDAEPYWVKEKALQIIVHIELADSSIRSGKYVPTTPDAFLDTVLARTKERIQDTAKHHQLDGNKDKTGIFVFFPAFPQK